MRLGLFPPADRAGGRWSAAAADDARARVGAIAAAVGGVPDLGASRAAEVLGGRLGAEVTADAVRELAALGVVEEVGEFKGHAVYCGLSLEQLAGRTDAREVLARAAVSGRRMTADEAAHYLRVRRVDFGHLVRTKWVEPVAWVRSGWRPRRHGPDCPLYRARDLDVLLTHPGIDWEQVRATPRGRPSPLARLSAVRGR